MQDYIIKESGDIVMKYRINKPPVVPDHCEIIAVDDVADYDVNQIADWY